MLRRRRGMAVGAETRRWSRVVKREALGLSRGHDVLYLGHLADHDSFDRDNAADTTHKPSVIRKAVLVLPCPVLLTRTLSRN